jgi:hypothetical protein
LGQCRPLLFLVGNRSQPSAGLHPFVQNSNDLNKPGLDRTEVDNVDRSAHRRPWGVCTDMSKVKAAQARLQVGAIARDEASRLVCHDAHCSRENRCVAALPHATPSFKTGGKNAGEIRLRRARQTEARHVGSARAFGCGSQVSDIIFEIGVLDLDEIAAFKRIDAGLYLRP